MINASTAARGKKPADRLTKEQVIGTEKRWRRFGEPVPAGGSVGADGEPDYGLFGPGSMVWEVLLHPTTLFLQNYAQATMQAKAYKPIVAGLRDWEPVSKKAQAGTATMFDVFERVSRNAGMHAPMWLGDSATAANMHRHLANIHRKVQGDLIDVGQPQLGGYDANSPRESLWAVLTEMHPMLRLYETFAFRDGRLPRRLTDAQRDQVIREIGTYLRLVHAPEEDIPDSMADVAALYDKYADLFAPSDTVNNGPDTGQNYIGLITASVTKNLDRAQLRAAVPAVLFAKLLELPVAGALPAAARHSMGYGRLQSAIARASSVLALPLMWVIQQPACERYALRYMWGPDAARLIDSARALHRNELAEA